MAWKKDSYRHGLASKGISTKNTITVDEASGVWFESRGMISEVVSLMNMLGFDEIMGKKEAKGYTKTSYEADSRKIVTLPASKVEQSVQWLESEWKTASPSRKRQLVNLVKMAVRRISRELGMTIPASTKVQLHRSREIYQDFLMDVGGV